MRKAGVVSYERFAKEVLENIGEKPVSFEVFADDHDGMFRQARIISNWGKNVYIKIPIVNSRGKPTLSLIQRLHNDGLKLNITAILAVKQLEELMASLDKPVSAFVSVFAGRIADTGRDPGPTIREARRLFSANPAVEVLWASTREVLNIKQAAECGAHIITVTSDILAKYESMNQLNLLELSRQTSEMFWKDAQKAGYSL